MESSVFRTLNMLQTLRGRNHAIIDDSYKECLSTVDTDSGQYIFIIIIIFF